MKAQRLINGVVTELLDPKLFYSRWNFLESGKDAIDLKYELFQGKRIGFQRYKLPSIADKYFSRSSNVKNKLGTSTDGAVRAKFSDNLKIFNAGLRDKVQHIKYKQ